LTHFSRMADPTSGIFVMEYQTLKSFDYARVG